MQEINKSEKVKRGLALLDLETRKAISSKGGKTGGHRWTSEEASEAGKKGGKISKRRPIHPLN